MADVLGINALPEELIEEIVSRTSPHACGMLSTVSKYFGSVANSDRIWEGFLPLDIISLRASPIGGRPDDPWKNIDSDTLHAFPTKKDLYLFLSDNPLIIDGGSTYFWLEKLSGKKCFGIGLAKLCEWGKSRADMLYRMGAYVPVQFFGAVNLELEGKIRNSLLSPNTNYTAYLLFSFCSSGLGTKVIEFAELHLKTWVGIDGHGENRIAYIPNTVIKDPPVKCPRYLVWRHDRSHGWYDVELGDYFNKELCVDSRELRMSLRQVERRLIESSIHLYGIEFRPKSSKKSNC